MSALKEFADFIRLNMANLAATYAQLLAESDAGYETFPADRRIISARKLLKAVISACELHSSEPLVSLFDTHADGNFRRWAEQIDPPQPLVEVECLGQTLTPVVINLDAGKFLWDMLSRLRAKVYQSSPSQPVPPVRAAVQEETDTMALPDRADDEWEQAPPSEGEARFRKIFDHAHEAIFIVDPVQDKILDINSQACRLLGYSQEELLALSFTAIHPHLLPQLMAFFQSVVDQGHGWTDELACMNKSGQELPVEISASVLGSEGGLSLLIFAQDISERKRTERLVAESEERYRLLLDLSPDPIIAYDTLDRVVYVNSAFTQTFGWSEDELRGQQINFVPEEKRSETETVLQQLSDRGKVLGFETKHLTKDGRIVEVQQNGAIIKDHEGKSTGSLIFIRELTELKVAQEMIQRQAHHEKTIREITDKLRVAPNLDVLLETAARELGQQLGVGHTVLELGIEAARRSDRNIENGQEGE